MFSSLAYQIFSIWGNFAELVGLLEDLREIHPEFISVPKQRMDIYSRFSD